MLTVVASRDGDFALFKIFILSDIAWNLYIIFIIINIK